MGGQECQCGCEEKVRELNQWVELLLLDRDDTQKQLDDLRSEIAHQRIDHDLLKLSSSIDKSQHTILHSVDGQHRWTVRKGRVVDYQGLMSRKNSVL